MKLVFLRWQIEYGEGERSSPVAEENRKTSIEEVAGFTVPRAFAVSVSRNGFGMEYRS